MASPSHRDRLERYCYVHNPKNIPKIAGILKSFQGRESHMFSTLEEKYGPQPTEEEATRCRLQLFFQRYNPAKLSSIDDILAAYSGPKRAELFPALVSKYGPEVFDEDSASSPSRSQSSASFTRQESAEPATPAASRASFGGDYRARLVRFMEAYNPAKLSSLDAILQTYQGREEEMFAALVKRYGPEPAAAGETPSASASKLPSPPPRPDGSGNDSGTQQQRTYRQRIEAIYAHYAPEKTHTIEAHLTKYKGQEQALLDALIQKYGPEPPATVDGGVAGNPALPNGPADDVKSRLTRFMEAYNPEKLSSIDKILDAYKGREAEMFEALVKKYGPEPGITTPQASIVKPRAQTESAAAPSSSSAEMDFKSRLTRFMEAYNPEKLSSIDKILDAYKGREAEMFEALVKKYGPEPQVRASGATADYRTRLMRFMEVYNPEKLSSIDKILDAYRGQEVEMFEALVKKYGPEPSPDEMPQASSRDDFKSRLTRFMEAYNPEKLSSIDKILDAYKGREAEMFEALVKKYGPEPQVRASQNMKAPLTDETAVNSFMQARGLTCDGVLFAFNEDDLLLSLSRAFGPLQDNRDVRTRVTAVLQKYNPDKLASVDMILKAYSGREDEMMKALVSKYGPEPPEDAGGTDASGDARCPRVRAFLTKKKVTTSAALFAVFPSKKHLLEYLQQEYGDYEGRLRRLLVRHCPEDLEHVEELLENHRGDEEALMADLVGRLGAEPPNDAPTVIVNMLTGGSPSSRLARIEDESAISDVDEDQDGPGGPRALQGEPPAIVKEGHLLIRDSERAPPGDYSGDEGKAFPGEEEYWLQLRVGGDRDTLDMSPTDLRRRTYSEYNPEMSDGDTPGSPGSMYRLRSESSFRAGSSSPSRTLEPQAAASVEVCSKLGKSIAALCLPCSKKVINAFDALWQPVGPGHKKVLGSSTTKEGFLEKLSTSRLGTKWQRRYFRVNDKGILYYETAQPNEKPKGYKVLTRRSTLRDAIDSTTHPKCTDSNFHYLSVSCNETNEEFLLRTASKEEKLSWAAFLKEALERVRLTTTGQDPVPARWRARVGGAKLSASELVVLTEESNLKARSLQAKRDALAKQLEEETQQLDITKTRATDLVEQEKQLRVLLGDLVEQVGAAEEDAELKCLSAAEAASQVVLQRESLDKELTKARLNVEKMTEAIVALEKRVVELEHVKHHEHIKLQQVFQKWRNVEQRPKSPSNGIGGPCVLGRV